MIASSLTLPLAIPLESKSHLKTKEQSTEIPFLLADTIVYFVPQSKWPQYIIDMIHWPQHKLKWLILFVVHIFKKLICIFQWMTRESIMLTNAPKYNQGGVSHVSNNVELKIDKHSADTRPFPWWCVSCSLPIIVIASFRQTLCILSNSIPTIRHCNWDFTPWLLHNSSFFTTFERQQQIKDILTLCWVPFCSNHTPLFLITHPKRNCLLVRG